MGDFNAKYNPKEIYNDSKQSKSNNDTKIEAVQKIPELLIIFAFYTTKNNFDNLCTPCITSKQTQIVNRSKPITKVRKKTKRDIH